MTKIIKSETNLSSMYALEFLKKHYEWFQPVKKLTIFFDSENFLLTKYKTDVHMVLENYQGDQLHIGGANCGYGGAGPNASADIFQFLGISEKEAHRLMYEDGIQMEFNEEGKLCKIENKVFIGSSFRPQYPFVIDDYTKVDSIGKVIYMINPQVNNFSGLLNAIDKMEIREFHYHIGPNSPFDDRIMSDRWFEKLMDKKWNIENREKLKGIKGVNLVLRGERYHIVCLINEKIAFTVVNLLHLRIFNRPLLEEKIIGQNVLLCKTNNESSFSFVSVILWIIGCFKKTEFGELISCSPKNKTKGDFYDEYE